MAEVTAEKLSQRLLDVGLLDLRQVDSVWGDLGTRHVSAEDYIAHLVRKEFLTNFQVERLIRGERTGFFYGPYKVLYIIGAGTFARVYRAVHRDTGRIMAVKVLRRRFREEPAQLEQFLREARMGMKLRHPNIVAIHDVDPDVRAPYMVMEFVEGQNLRELIRVRKSMPPLTAMKLLADIAAGLAYAGEQGITHRDLKMSNVLVSSVGRAKLVDFGLAAAANRDNEDALADCPNARAIDYATLERGTGVRKDDARSDIFFAGCILYQMMCGEWPLTETRDRLQRLNVSRFQNITPLGKMVADCPPVAITIANKAMEWDPTRRYQNPGDLLADAQAAIRRLEQGDGAAAALPKASGTASAESAGMDGDPTREGESRTVMIVESKTEMQDILRDALKRRGYKVLVFGDARRALARFEMDPDAADCVLFSTPDLAAEAVEAFNQFGSNETTASIPAILLVDQKQRSLIQRAHLASHRVILALPLRVRELRATLVKLLASETPAGRN